MENFNSFVTEAPKKNNFSITFLGDIMNHQIQMDKAWNGTKHDYMDFFKHIKEELKSVDFCVGNLETVFGGKPYAGIPPEFGHDAWRFSSPDELAYALANSGINCLVTANNHSADCSADGVKRTIDILDRYGIKHTGTFKDDEDISPLILEKNGVKLAILNYTYGLENRMEPKPHIVNLIGDVSDIPDTKPHPKNINFKKIGLDIIRAKKVVDKVVVFFHWGDGYKIEPNENQVSLKEFCFIKGADIVIGSHPHVIQPSYWDKKNDTYVAYSLGNFMAYQSQPKTTIGLIVKMDISKNKIENVKEYMISTLLYPKRLQ
jgi:poly-gamma-glutamate synthesis protein (capsule biosynthesis protein)